MAGRAVTVRADNRLMDRWRLLLSQLGPVDAILYLVDRVLAALSGGKARLVKYHIVAQPLGLSGATRLRPDSKTVLALTPPSSPLCAMFPRPPDIIASRYASGGQCLSAMVGEVFGGYVWWQRGHYEEDEVRCTFELLDAQTCVWDYDVYISPQFRLGRLMARLWQAADDHLASQGVRWTFSRISAFNPASMTSHARLGAMRRESATFLVLGGFQVSMLAQPPYLHVSWHDSQRPRLRLPPP